MAICYRVGSTGVIGAMCDAVGLTKTIDACVTWDEDQCKLSPGTRIKAIIINILSGRDPLYLVHEFFEYMDLEPLFGAGVHYTDFKDYALARALDKIFEVGAQKVFSNVALQAIAKEEVTFSRIHADTTSWTVTGTYDGYDTSAEDQLTITKGYNKDHRPGSKQFIYGLVVTEEKIPLIGHVVDGNVSDKVWNTKALEELSSKMNKQQLEQLTYVADSSFVTPENLKKAKDLKFISRLPNVYSLETTLKKKAWEANAWKDIGVIAKTVKKDSASYRYQEFEAPLYEQDYRFIVVHSSKLDVKKVKTLEKNISLLREKLEKTTAVLMTESFACIPDAETAIAKFKNEHRNEFFSIEGQVIATNQAVKREGKGRPKKDESREYQTVYQLELKVGELNQAAFQREKERLSCFVLVTNIMDSSKSGATILDEYKSQSSVELQFKAIKDPEFVGALYLKRPERIQALAYVVLMALLIKNLLARRVRNALKTETEPLIMPGKVKSWTPTADKILDMFSVVNVIHTTPGVREISMTRGFPKRLFELARINPDVYLYGYRSP